MEWLQENPGHPPKQWMRHCVAGASKSARDPGAACGALWYHKMSESQRRAALAKERRLEENQGGSLLVPLAIGAVVVGGILWWASQKKETTAAANATCPVDLKKFNAWLIEKGLAGECAPKLSVPPATYSDLQSLALAPAQFNPYVLVIADGSFWYYAEYKAKAERSDNLRNQFNTFAASSLKGHPVDLFLW